MLITACCDNLINNCYMRIQKCLKTIDTVYAEIGGKVENYEHNLSICCD